MAPLAARLASARRVARGAPIRVTAIERKARHPLHGRHAAPRSSAAIRDRRFVWLMGADNLAQFHLWRDWRSIAAHGSDCGRRLGPAMMTRALKAPAMGWLRALRPARGQGSELDEVEIAVARAASTAARPDLRHRHSRRPSHWHEAVMKTFEPRAIRDGVTRRSSLERRPFARHHTRSV